MNSIRFVVQKVHKKKISILYFLMIFFIISNNNSMVRANDRGVDNMPIVKFQGIVKEVAMIVDEKVPILKPWCAVVLITSRTSGDFRYAKPGDTVYIYVHSIYKSFKRNETNVIGKYYEFTFHDEFKKHYSGKIDITEAIIHKK